MFASSKWLESKWAQDQKGKSVANIVFMPSFWNTIIFALKVLSSFVSVLRLVDSENKAKKKAKKKGKKKAKKRLLWGTYMKPCIELKKL